MYLLKLKNLVDTLAHAGHYINDENQILHILSGLGPDYNPIMMTMIAKLDAYSVDEVTSLLLTFEKNLEQQSQCNESFVTNVVSNSGRSGGFRGNYSYNRLNNYNQRGGNNGFSRKRQNE